MVQDGIDGLLFDSEAEFSEKAERLIREPQLRQGLGRKAREKIEQEFSREGEIQEYLQLYEQALAAESRR